MKSAVKFLDDRVFDQAYRRTKINARRLAGVDGQSSMARQFLAWSRERSISPSEFIYRTPEPRFIGGTTGRSGTRWLVRLLKQQFTSKPVVMDEIGVFVLSSLREAAYEYYQFGTDNAAQLRGAYLNYFLRQVRTYAFRRRNVYGAGMRGLIEYIPQRAIKMAGAALAKDLPGLNTFDDIRERFGQFYLHLLNYHAAIIHDGQSGWISKEPPYGRHADELLAMVPHGKLVILARDGRASALSMYRRGWGKSVRDCMRRWGEFARMTLAALERVGQADPRVLVLTYEDMVTDFDTELRKIHDFFALSDPDFNVLARDATLKPRPESIDRWKDEIDADDLRWFDSQFGDTMAQLGYTQ
jgi:hypothetical protein